MKLTTISIDEVKQAIIDDVSSLLQQTPNLTSLEIIDHGRDRESALTGREICTITPSHVKHLATRFEDLNDAKIILKGCPTLSTAKFFHSCKKWNIDFFLEWLEESEPDSLYYNGPLYIKVWLRHTSNRSTTVTKSNKRIRLADDCNT